MTEQQTTVEDNPAAVFFLLGLWRFVSTRCQVLYENRLQALKKHGRKGVALFLPPNQMTVVGLAPPVPKNGMVGAGYFGTIPNENAQKICTILSQNARKHVI